MFLEDSYGFKRLVTDLIGKRKKACRLFINQDIDNCSCRVINCTLNIDVLLVQIIRSNDFNIFTFYSSFQPFAREICKRFRYWNGDSNFFYFSHQTGCYIMF